MRKRGGVSGSCHSPQPVWHPPPIHSLVVPVLLLESDELASVSEAGRRCPELRSCGSLLPFALLFPELLAVYLRLSVLGLDVASQKQSWV